MTKILQFDHKVHPFKDVLLSKPGPRPAMPARAPWESLTVVDLFCGAGGSSSGIVRALQETGRKVNLVAVNHWATACHTMKTNYPDALVFNASVEVVDPAYAVPGGRIDLLVASPECFPAGTLILTNKGYLPIENIAVGDKVLTHKNRWKKVTATMKKRADTIIVRGHGHYGIETTKEHPFLAKKRGQKWNNQQRRYETTFDKTNWVNAEDLIGHSWATPRSFGKLPIPKIGGRGMEFTDDFWWMIGRWLGDGSLAKIGKSNPEINICCGKHEAGELAERLNAFCPQGENYRAGYNELRWRQRTLRTATLFECAHKGLSDWLLSNFGQHAHGKRIPGWVLTMPESHRRALLQGYLSADGHLEKVRNSQVQTYHSTSKSLALGIRSLAESLGEFVALYYRSKEKAIKNGANIIEDRKVNVRDAYAGSWYIENSHGIHHSNENKSWHTVKEITPGRKNVEVYNFEVEDDNSYVADGIVVHNCITYSPARGKKNPIREQSRSSAAFIYEWLANPHVYVESFLLENVSEWQQWGALDENLHPIKERQGEYFDSFLSELRKIGYNIDYRVLNAADYGDVTSRKRLFVMGRADGEQILWPEQSHAENPQKIKGRKIPRWRAAWEVIDWNVHGTSIFNRPKGPHAVKTLIRMRAGFAKQSGALALAYVEALDRFIPIAQDYQDASKAIETTWVGKSKIIARARAEEKAAAAEIARERSIEAFLQPVGLYQRLENGEPISMVLGQHGGATARNVQTETVPTIATGGAIAKFDGIFDPVSLLSDKAKNKRPLNNLTKEYFSELTVQAIDGFTFPVNHGGGEERSRSYDEILGTFTTKGSDAKADPTIESIAFVSEQRGFYEKNIDYSARGSDQPLSGITAHTNHHALIKGENSLTSLEPEAFISHMRGYFGDERLSRTASSTESPLDTIAASGNHHAIVRAKIVQNEAGLIRPWILLDGVPYAIDILFRMLMNKELAHAMSFIDEGYDYNFAGSTQAITRQIGNAVPVRLSSALVGAQLRFYIDPKKRKRGGRAKKADATRVAA